MVLKAVHREAGSSTRYTLVAVSYRGYWTSRGRPSERGIGLDAAAAIEYARSRLRTSADPPIRLVLWGQSIGAGVATSAAAALSSIVPKKKGSRNGDSALASPVSGLVLETPFASVRAMLTAVYPQRGFRTDTSDPSCEITGIASLHCSRLQIQNPPAPGFSSCKLGTTSLFQVARACSWKRGVEIFRCMCSASWCPVRYTTK